MYAFSWVLSSKLKNVQLPPQGNISPIKEVPTCSMPVDEICLSSRSGKFPTSIPCSHLRHVLSHSFGTDIYQHQKLCETETETGHNQNTIELLHLWQINAEEIVVTTRICQKVCHILNRAKCFAMTRTTTADIVQRKPAVVNLVQTSSGETADCIVYKPHKFWSEACGSICNLLANSSPLASLRTKITTIVRERTLDSDCCGSLIHGPKGIDLVNIRKMWWDAKDSAEVL